MNLNIIKYTLFLLFIGLILTTFFAQRDEWVKNQVGIAVKKSVEQTYNCDFDCTVHSFNLFTGTVELKNVTLHPRQPESWQWHCASLVASISLPTFCMYGMIDLGLTIEGLEAHSEYKDGKLAIATHIKQLLFGSSRAIPVAIKSIKLNKSLLAVQNAAAQVTTDVWWTSEIQFAENGLHSTFSLDDGELKVQKKPVMANLTGSVELDVAYHVTAPTVTVSVNGAFKTPLLTEDPLCVIKGMWQGMQGEFTMHNVSKSVNVFPIKIINHHNERFLHLGAEFPLEIAKNIFPELANITLAGSGSVSLTRSLDTEHMQAAVECANVECSALPFTVDKCTVHVTGKDKKLFGSIATTIQKTEFGGTWHLDEQTHKGSIELSNVTNVFLPSGWHIPSQMGCLACVGNFSPDKKKSFTGTYNVAATNGFNAHTLRGDISYDGTKLTTAGNLDATAFNASYVTQHPAHIENITVRDQNNAVGLALQAEEDKKTLQGTLHIAQLKDWLSYAGINFYGTGGLNFCADAQTGYKTWRVNMAPKSSIRIPAWHNCLEQACMNISFDAQHILIADFLGVCTKGVVSCPRATVALDEKASLLSMHCPITLENCAFNAGKNFFADVSGNVLISKELSKPILVAGNIFLERAEIFGGMFGASAKSDKQQDTDTYCNIAVTTKKPVHIQTDELDAYAHVALNINNTLNSPHFAGSVTFNSGVISFPYKDLLISKGTLYLLPDQTPVIELLAHNMVRKYSVSVHVNGPVDNQEIVAESSPSLSDEQIFSLLVTGREYEDLNAVAPALIMNNIKSAAFGQKPFLFLERYLQRFIKPLRTVNAMPILAEDQDLQASIEVELGENWRALAQKKLHSPERAHAELEYALSDEFCVRGIRDVHGDVRGEVELRWKWG